MNGVDPAAGYMPLNNDLALSALMVEVVKENIPGNSGVFQIKQSFAKSSTDMGDVSAIMPILHASIPGGGGHSHGTDYFIADKKKAYLDNTKILALMAVELLYGDAARGKKIAADRDGKLPIGEYVRRTDAFNRHETFNEK